MAVVAEFDSTVRSCESVEPEVVGWISATTAAARGSVEVDVGFLLGETARLMRFQACLEAVTAHDLVLSGAIKVLVEFIVVGKRDMVERGEGAIGDSGKMKGCR